MKGDSKVTGTVKFQQENESELTKISWMINSNEKNTMKGIHIHQFGDSTNGCISSGPHFNPFSKQHGSPNDTQRHVGDLGNISFDSTGFSKGEMIDSQVKLIGENSVIGRSIVLHEQADDLGKGNFEDSKTTGHAGARIACGIIGYC